MHRTVSTTESRDPAAATGPALPATRPLSRRDFLATASIAAGFAATSGVNALAADERRRTRFPIIGFSKPFQKLGPEQTADLVTKVGWDGIECPVRNRGQIEPSRVSDDLPRLVEVLRSRKLDVLMVATDITSMKSPHAETILRTLAKLNIQRFRLGFSLYPQNQSPAARLKELAPALQEIAAACRQFGLQAGFQNHSGAKYVGAPVWDVYSLLRDLDPSFIGFCFDIGHATVEGGLSWPTEARLVESHLTAVLVKDFYWRKEPTGWRDTWCPLGEGMVNRSFFDWLKKTQYRGPICQHHEYPLGQPETTLAYFQRDLKVLREWLDA
jgi:sugar phosphate isomerase/epimerase